MEYDRLGRAVESQIQHAFVTSYAARRFDRLGRLVLETEPFTDPALLFDLDAVPQTRAEHDDMGRVLSTLTADGVRTVYGYPRNAREVQTEGGGEYVTELDAAGRVLAVVEPGSTSANRTTYQYCRSGLLRRTLDPAGNTTTVEYDDLGRRTLLDDPAAGVARFEYDAFDDLERTEDALGRVNRWERDVLGRVEALHHDAEGITDRFFYDTAPRGTSGATVLGALASTESGDGVIDTFEYDGLARSVAQSRFVDGRLLRVSSTLDAFGRVTSTTHPDALGLGAVVLSTTYDSASGEPLAVDLDGAALWELRGQDARGVPSEERLGSSSWGVIDRLSDYTAAGRLETLTSISGSTVLQDLHYGYSLRGLLAQREDGVAGRTETFDHDALSRLTAVSETGLSAPRETYTIDAIGNLVSTHEGSVLYEDPSRPYAATEARGESVEYDDVGNAFHVGDLSLTYTQRNLPRTVDSGKTGLVQYRYDASGGRATKRSRDVDITYFGAYELERRGMLLYERISLSTPAGVVAQIERANGGAGQNATSRLRWLLSERQGSVETTWVNGEAPAHHRYDAYGGVLSSGGSATGERPSATVSAGYTGHEHEDDIGLVNMGGRVYSPTLRRFLTADPVVMTPFGQGLNAYSYVRGNPLNAIDPFGWCEPEAGASRCEDFDEGALAEPVDVGAGAIVIRGQVALGTSDARASETVGAGAAGAAVPQATDSERPGPPRGSLQDAARADLGDLFSLSPQMREVPRFMESLNERLGGIPAALGESGAQLAAAGLTVASSTIPVVGEAMDVDTMLDDNAPTHFRVMASASLGVSAATGGLSPNAGALIRATAHIDDAVRAGRRMFRVGTYRPRVPGFENHHGVLDVWAAHNIPGYVRRGASTPTIALTAAEHAATKRVYRDWLEQRTGRAVGGTVDWSQVSAREAQALSDRMLDAAGVTLEARREYYRAFHNYVYGAAEAVE